MYIYEHGSYKDMKVWTVMKNIRTWDIQTRVGEFNPMYGKQEFHATEQKIELREARHCHVYLVKYKMCGGPQEQEKVLGKTNGS